VPAVHGESYFTPFDRQDFGRKRLGQVSTGRIPFVPLDQRAGKDHQLPHIDWVYHSERVSGLDKEVPRQRHSQAGEKQARAAPPDSGGRHDGKGKGEQYLKGSGQHIKGQLYSQRGDR
jgi:hypothetical protein